MLRPSDAPRRQAIKIVESAVFEPVILLTIAANAVTMAWESPLDPAAQGARCRPPPAPPPRRPHRRPHRGPYRRRGRPPHRRRQRCRRCTAATRRAPPAAPRHAAAAPARRSPCASQAAIIAVCEWVFLFIYTGELSVKIVAMGFANHRAAYLRDPVPARLCGRDAGPSSPLPVQGVSALRSVRALRPLRALKRVPGMPVLVSSIIGVLPKMRDVAILCAFVFLIFGIIGTELFKGALHFRCALLGFVEPDHPTMYGASRRALAQQEEYDTEAFCKRRGGGGGRARWMSGAYFDANPRTA